MRDMTEQSAIAVVAIGRNEGARLKVCLASVLKTGLAQAVVYVDSGSCDGSADYARSLGCEVVDLDMSTPFTAARARNAGFAHAMASVPNLAYVQFIDGDCELLPDWLPTAHAALHANPELAAVCGRLRERFPERSVYNQMCDIEWNTALGEVKACGGIALFRASAFTASGGFLETLIAGEEPELCVRLRAAGWRILRIDQDMALHDAAMLHFGQWWARSKRAGYAFAEGAFLHGRPPERHWVRESRSARLWGAGIPVTVTALALALGPWALALLLVYPLQVLRIYRRVRGTLPAAGWYATLLVVGKLPEALGQFKFLLNRVLDKRAALIEYK
jgi:GT2 family glycosyltransferase